MARAASDAAISYGVLCAAKLFEGRKGHGGGKVSTRVLDRAQLIALMAIAFDAGRESP